MMQFLLLLFFISIPRVYEINNLGVSAAIVKLVFELYASFIKVLFPYWVSQLDTDRAQRHFKSMARADEYIHDMNWIEMESIT